MISGIISIEDGNQEVFVLSIWSRKPAPAYIINPFACYPEFGAQLWSTEFKEEIVCIPATQPICHSESCTWVTDVVVLKAISSVGLQTCQFLKTYHIPLGDLNNKNSCSRCVFTLQPTTDKLLYVLGIVHVEEGKKVWAGLCVKMEVIGENIPINPGYKFEDVLFGRSPALMR